MKDQLVEELLDKVMGWKSPQDFVEHGLPLQAIAAYKYDEYQQFSPGMRFIESLALWLGQFETIQQLRAALKFVLDRLMVISSAEKNFLGSTFSAYPILRLPLSHGASEYAP